MRFGERLFELAGAIGGLLGLHAELGFELVSVGDGLVMLGVERGGGLVGFQRRRLQFDDPRPGVNPELLGLGTGLLNVLPGLLGGCSELLGFCRRLLSCDLVLSSELCDLGVGCRGHRPLCLGGGFLDLDDSALGVCRRLLRGRRDLLGSGELRLRFGERLFELAGAIGGSLALNRELSFELLSVGDGLVMLGVE